MVVYSQQWRDPRLAWEPAAHGGRRHLDVPHSAVWTPKLFVYNSVNTKELLGTEATRNELRVTHDGLVRLNTPLYVSCTCRLDISVSGEARVEIPLTIH
jgi:Neurotransmitter-gated ion-channel ligand binding domain